jgi:hypothetical protein
MPRLVAAAVADQRADDQAVDDQAAESLPAAIGPKGNRADTKAHNHSVVDGENLAADAMNRVRKAQPPRMVRDKTEIPRPMVEKTLLPVLPPAIVANPKPPVPKAQPREPRLRIVTRRITRVPREPLQALPHRIAIRPTTRELKAQQQGPPPPIAMPQTIPEPKEPLQVPPSPTTTNPHSPVPRARPPDPPPSEIPSTILGSTETIGMAIIPVHGLPPVGLPVQSGGQPVGAPSPACAAMRPRPSRITTATT